MNARPLRNKFYFQFEDGATRLGFQEKTAAGVILPVSQETAKNSRWGIVTAIGKDVKEFAVGDKVLIESMMWTNVINYSSERFWMSDEDKVIAVLE
jgi:co-chaperonin GroES (HSP10)